MNPNVRDFSEISKFIRENPKQADAQAFEWEKFLKLNAPQNPELYSIETSEEFYKWASEHPEKNIDTSVWRGKEISDSYFDLRDQHEEDQMQHEGRVDPSIIPSSLAALPFMAAMFLEKPKTMEEDSQYQKIEEKLKKEWLEKNPGKNFSSKEWLDYEFGRLDSSDALRTGAGEEMKAEENFEEQWAKSVNAPIPRSPTLSRDAESLFRSNPKFKKRVERYDKESKKIYKKPHHDPATRLKETRLFEEVSKRQALLKAEKPKDPALKSLLSKISEDVQTKHFNIFFLMHPEKAKAYYQKSGEERGGEEEVYVPLREPKGNQMETIEPQPSSPKTFQGSFPGRSSFSRVGRATRGAGRAGARIAGQTGKAAAQVVGRSILAFLTSPVGIALFLIVILTFIIVFSVGGGPSNFQPVTGETSLSPTPTSSPEPSTPPTPPAEP